MIIGLFTIPSGGFTDDAENWNWAVPAGEFNFTLGKIRADALPPLNEGEIGWYIVARPKLTIPESKVKALAKDVRNRLKKMQEDHAETPWAFFAERESRGELGMDWAGRKK